MTRSSSKKAIPGPGENVDFFAGNAAMTITQISRASLLPKDKPFSWDLVPLPKGPAGDYALIGQAGIGVMQSGKNAKTAAEFIAYMTNPENSAKLSQFFPSARKSLLNAEVLKKTNPLLSQEQIDKVVIAGIATGKVIPGHTELCADPADGSLRPRCRLASGCGYRRHAPDDLRPDRPAAQALRR